MTPAGSGRAQFCPGSGADGGGGRLLALDSSSPEPRLKMQDVQSLLGRVQSLVGTRPSGGNSAAWCVEAAFLGDLGSIGAAAILAARSSPAPH